MEEMMLIAQRLKELRKAKDLTLVELGKRTGFTNAFLSKLENARCSPPIATLSKIADALDTRLNYFFKEKEDRTATLTRKGKGSLVQNGEGYIAEVFALDQANKTLQPLIITIKPGATVKKCLCYKGDGYLYMLQGRISFEMGTAVYDMGLGDSLYFAASVPHRMRNTGKGTAKFILITAKEV